MRLNEEYHNFTGTYEAANTMKMSAMKKYR